MQVENTSQGQNIRLPYSLSPPRVGQEESGSRKNESCLICDFGISEGSLTHSKQNPEFLRMIVDIASKNMSSNFLKGHEEVKTDFKVLA